MLRLLAAVAPLLAAGAVSAAAAEPPVVVLDPGHDLRANPATEPIGPGSAVRKVKDGGGTRGVVTGIAEAELNLRVALLLRPMLERAGVRVVMTRTRSAGTSVGNVARARVANDAGAALFLRIHADGHPASSAVRGTHVLVPALRHGWTDDIHAESRRAAAFLLDEVVRELRFPRRGISERADFTGFNWADVPVVLVELGFMTNPTEDRLLARERVRGRAALGLCRGVMRYLGRATAGCA